MPALTDRTRQAPVAATPPLVVERVVLSRGRTISVVRDDLVPGGTKARVLHVLFDPQHDEYVYASPVQGYAQVALAHCCAAHRKRATVFCAARRERYPLTDIAERAGAKIVEVGPCGYLSVVTKRARDYCDQTGARLLPFGLCTPEVIAEIARVASTIDEPAEVWSVASSGTLSRGLQLAWPRAVVHAVRVGAIRDLGRAVVHYAPEKYEQRAKMPPPFSSCENYDGKAWRFLIEHASDGALFWNVAASAGLQ